MKPLDPATLAPSGEVLAAVTTITAVLKEIQELKAAILRIQPQHQVAQKRMAELNQRRADTLVQRAMQIEPEAVKAFGTRIDAIEKEQAAVARDLESVELAERALQEKLQNCEERGFEMGRAGSSVTNVAGSQLAIVQILDQRLREIVEMHLLPFVLEVQAMHAASGSGFHTWLDSLVIPDFRSNGSLLTGARSFLDGSVPLSNLWREDPNLMAAHDVAAVPTRAVRQLRSVLPSRLRGVSPFGSGQV